MILQIFEAVSTQFEHVANVCLNEKGMNGMSGKLTGSEIAI